MKFLKVLSFASYLYGWYQRAATDGVITIVELAQVVHEGLRIFGLSDTVRVDPLPDVYARDARHAQAAKNNASDIAGDA